MRPRMRTSTALRLHPRNRENTTGFRMNGGCVQCRSRWMARALASKQRFARSRHRPRWPNPKLKTLLRFRTPQVCIAFGVATRDQKPSANSCNRKARNYWMLSPARASRPMLLSWMVPTARDSGQECLNFHRTDHILHCHPDAWREAPCRLRRRGRRQRSGALQI